MQISRKQNLGPNIETHPQQSMLCSKQEQQPLDDTAFRSDDHKTSTQTKDQLNKFQCSSKTTGLILIL